MARAGQFRKGSRAGPGRPPGLRNKATTEVKDAIALAFEDIGGREAFSKWAKSHRDLFYTSIWTKLLPLTLNVNNKLRVETVVEVREMLVASGVPAERIGQIFEMPQIPDGEQQITVANGRDDH